MLLKEPVLDWRQRDCSGHQILWGTDGLIRGRHNRQLSNRLVLEKLSRREIKAGATSLRDELQAENRVTAESEKVIVDAYALDIQDLRSEEHTSELQSRF